MSAQSKIGLSQRSQTFLNKAVEFAGVSDMRCRGFIPENLNAAVARMPLSGKDTLGPTLLRSEEGVLAPVPPAGAWAQLNVQQENCPWIPEVCSGLVENLIDSFRVVRVRCDSQSNAQQFVTESAAYTLQCTDTLRGDSKWA